MFVNWGNHQKTVEMDPLIPTFDEKESGSGSHIRKAKWFNKTPITHLRPSPIAPGWWLGVIWNKKPLSDTAEQLLANSTAEMAQRHLHYIQNTSTKTHQDGRSRSRQSIQHNMNQLLSLTPQGGFNASRLRSPPLHAVAVFSSFESVEQDHEIVGEGENNRNNSSSSVFGHRNTITVHIRQYVLSHSAACTDYLGKIVGEENIHITAGGVGFEDGFIKISPSTSGTNNTASVASNTNPTSNTNTNIYAKLEVAQNTHNHRFFLHILPLSHELLNFSDREQNIGGGGGVGKMDTGKIIIPGGGIGTGITGMPRNFNQQEHSSIGTIQSTHSLPEAVAKWHSRAGGLEQLEPICTVLPTYRKTGAGGSSKHNLNQQKANIMLPKSVTTMTTTLDNGLNANGNQIDDGLKLEMTHLLYPCKSLNTFGNISCIFDRVNNLKNLPQTAGPHYSLPMAKTKSSFFGGALATPNGPRGVWYQCNSQNREFPTSTPLFPLEPTEEVRDREKKDPFVIGQFERVVGGSNDNTNQGNNLGYSMKGKGKGSYPLSSAGGYSSNRMTKTYIKSDVEYLNPKLYEEKGIIAPSSEAFLRPEKRGQGGMYNNNRVSRFVTGLEIPFTMLLNETTQAENINEYSNIHGGSYIPSYNGFQQNGEEDITMFGMRRSGGNTFIDNISESNIPQSSSLNTLCKWQLYSLTYQILEGKSYNNHIRTYLLLHDPENPQWQPWFMELSNEKNLMLEPVPKVCESRVSTIFEDDFVRFSQTRSLLPPYKISFKWFAVDSCNQVDEDKLYIFVKICTCVSAGGSGSGSGGNTQNSNSNGGGDNNISNGDLELRTEKSDLVTFWAQEIITNPVKRICLEDLENFKGGR